MHNYVVKIFKQFSSLSLRILHSIFPWTYKYLKFDPIADLKILKTDQNWLCHRSIYLDLVISHAVNVGKNNSGFEAIST